VLLGPEGELIGSILICNSKLDNEELIVYQFAKMTEWLLGFLEDEDTLAALIEGLSFGSVGSGKDFLAGLQWYFRARFKVEFATYLGTVPVSLWRSKVLTKEEQREVKAAGKDGLKWAVFNKLPAVTRKQYADYVEILKDEINMAKDSKLKPGSKSKKYVDALQDLADAHFIAKHCFNLSITK
jgi:hypothetical protein